MDEKEMMITLSEVAKLKTEFQLLKNAILNSCDLDYNEELCIRDSQLVMEVMWLIAEDEMTNCFDIKKSKADERRAQLVAMTKEDDNG